MPAEQPSLEAVTRGADDARKITDRVIDADPRPPRQRKGPKPRPIPPEIANATHADEFDDAPDTPDAGEELPQEGTDTECGLPDVLEGDKKSLVEYVNLHVSIKERLAVEVTPAERRLYEFYTRGHSVKRAPLDFFVCALRLWRHNFPLKLKTGLDMNSMRID